MDSKTGRIIEMTEEQDRVLRTNIRERGRVGLSAGRMIPIPEDQRAKVQTMNRRQRRAWAAQQKHLLK